MNLRRALITMIFAGAATGCASAGQSWRAGPAGIPAENHLRAQMTAGQFGSALESLKDKKIAPADALLRHMYKGLVAMHAGQNELGTRALDRAWEITYQRWTKRVSDGVATMVTGEGALPYEPGAAERMLIPYYGGLNWLARNERDEAAVEARRMSVLLASDAGDKPNAEFVGVMRYIAGVMFETTGERNDADVAYRNATELLGGRLPGDTVPPDSAHGDVVVLIEDGFVVRPEPVMLDFWIEHDEAAMLDKDDYGVRLETFRRIEGRRRPLNGDRYPPQYRNVSIRWPVMASINPLSGAGAIGARATRVAGDRGAVYGDSAAAGIVLPTIASTSTDSTGGVTDASLAAAPVVADVIGTSISAAIRADFERDQPARLSRALGRLAVREFSLKGASAAFDAAGNVLDGDDDGEKSTGKGKKGDKKDDSNDDGDGKGWAAAGLILLGVGLLAANLSSQVLDQPDLRAWQLLPDRVSVARMRLPVGEHVVEVTRDGEAYSLGTVTVKPGAVTVLVHRWWPGREPVVADGTTR